MASLILTDIPCHKRKCSFQSSTSSAAAYLILSWTNARTTSERQCINPSYMTRVPHLLLSLLHPLNWPGPVYLPFDVFFLVVNSNRRFVTCTRATSTWANLVQTQSFWSPWFWIKHCWRWRHRRLGCVSFNSVSQLSIGQHPLQSQTPTIARWWSSHCIIWEKPRARSHFVTPLNWKLIFIHSVWTESKYVCPNNATSIRHFCKKPTILRHKMNFSTEELDLKLVAFVAEMFRYSVRDPDTPLSYFWISRSSILFLDQ